MRSVPSGSFERLSAPESLWRAFREHIRGKGRRPGVARFNLDADRHVFALHRALMAGSYQPDRFAQMIVRDPKTRLISTPSLRDRVLHQAMISELAPHYEPSFIEHSYACRVGLGPQRAVLQHRALGRRFRFCVALDIRRCFPSIDHGVLLELVLRRLRDPRTRALLTMLIRAGGDVYRTPLAVRVLGLDADPLVPGTGLPIGSLLSQWSANLYLDGLDHQIKRVLKVPGYLRYMDDFILFADDRGFLRAAQAAVAVWLETHRRLALKDLSAHVHQTREPCTVLGFRLGASVRPGKKMTRRLRGKVRAAAARGPSALARTVRSYRALWQFG